MYGLPLLPEIWFPQPFCIASGDQSITHRCLPEAATSQRGAVSYSLFLLRRNRVNNLKRQTMQPRRPFTQKLEAPWRSALEELHLGESWQKTHPVPTKEAGAKQICPVKDRRVERPVTWRTTVSWLQRLLLQAQREKLSQTPSLSAPLWFIHTSSAHPLPLSLGNCQLPSNSKMN